jgi:hypothetical protein
MSAASERKTRLARGFAVTDAMVADFRKYLESEGIDVDADAFAKDQAFIRAMMHYDIDLALFGVGEAQKNLVAQDPQAQFALQQFDEAQHLTELARARGPRAKGVE